MELPLQQEHKCPDLCPRKGSATDVQAAQTAYFALLVAGNVNVLAQASDAHCLIMLQDDWPGQHGMWV